MQRLDDGIWTAEADLRFFGLEIGSRMTAIRLTDGSLLLHSPVRATDALLGEVRALGPVSRLVAPNKFHHLSVGDWHRAFPDARVHVAPGLDAKRPDLEVHALLGDEPDPAWADVLDQVHFHGFPLVNETVFFHRASATLVATDLAFHAGPSFPRPTRIAFKLMGAYGELAPTPLERLIIRDRAAFRACFERVLAWPFERVVVAHGAVVETGGREQLLRNYAWLLRA